MKKFMRPCAIFLSVVMFLNMMDLGVFAETVQKVMDESNNPYYIADEDKIYDEELLKIIYVFLTIFLYLPKCPQSLILSALRAFCFCGKPHISRSIFLYFRYQAWLKSW